MTQYPGSENFRDNILPYANGKLWKNIGKCLKLVSKILTFKII